VRKRQPILQPTVAQLLRMEMLDATLFIMEILTAKPSKVESTIFRMWPRRQVSQSTTWGAVEHPTKEILPRRFFRHCLDRWEDETGKQGDEQYNPLL